jgi:hypothetical protein
MYELVSFSDIRDFPSPGVPWNRLCRATGAVPLGARAAAQGGFYFFTNRTTISTMDARRCVAIVGEV